MNVLCVHILLFCFPLPFVSLLAELSLDKVCHCYIFLHFLLSGKFAGPLWVSAGTLLVCGGVGSDQSVLEISKDWVPKLLTPPSMRFFLSQGLSAVPKGAWVDFVDPYLLRHSRCINYAFLCEKWHFVTVCLLFECNTVHT